MCGEPLTSVALVLPLRDESLQPIRPHGHQIKGAHQLRGLSVLASRSVTMTLPLASSVKHLRPRSNQKVSFRIDRKKWLQFFRSIRVISNQQPALVAREPSTNSLPAPAGPNVCRKPGHHFPASSGGVC
jgi:hypothetical protein